MLSIAIIPDTFLPLEAKGVRIRFIAEMTKENPYLVVIGSNRLKLKGLSRMRALASVAKKIGEGSSHPILLVK
jgi:hypothetical protein